MQNSNEVISHEKFKDKSMTEKLMKIIDCSKTVERIDVKSNKKSEKLNSNQLPKKDVHVWTTPKNIQKIGETIYETLVKYESINKDYYSRIRTSLHSDILS